MIQGRPTVKALLKTCVRSKEVQGKTFKTPQKNNLPEYRVTCEFAFQNVGLDFAGPLFTLDIFNPNNTMHKCYVVLFT